MKGMDDGYDPHLVDFSRFVRETLDDISIETVARCWPKAHILSPAHEAELIIRHGKQRFQSDPHWAEEVVGLFGKLTLSKTQMVLCSTTCLAFPLLRMLTFGKYWGQWRPSMQYWRILLDIITESVGSFRCRGGRLPSKWQFGGLWWLCHFYTFCTNPYSFYCLNHVCAARESCLRCKCTRCFGLLA